MSTKPLLDVVLMTLHSMPSIEWSIKVLNQLPPAILQCCLRLLKSHPTLSQFEKRQNYSKLLKDIVLVMTAKTFGLPLANFKENLQSTPYTLF